MENDLMTFAKRLQQARLKARLSMEKLCEKMNGLVTKQAISKYEKAKMMPSSTILISLAEVLDCDIDYFFRPFTFELDQFKVSFRKKSDTTAGDQKALKVQIQDEVERYLEIEDVLQLKPTALLSEPLVPSQPLSSSSDMVEMAQKVRVAWQLGNAPILNAMELLEAHGVKGSMAGIAATSLSEHAKKHELAAKGRNTEFIEKDIDAFLDEYDSVIEYIKQYLKESAE